MAGERLRVLVKGRPTWLEKGRILVDGPARAGIQGLRSVAAVPRPHLPSGSLLNAQLILLGLFALCLPGTEAWCQDKAGKAGPFASGHLVACLDQAGLGCISGR